MLYCSEIKWCAVLGMIRKILPLAEQTTFTTTHHDDVLQYIYMLHAGVFGGLHYPPWKEKSKDGWVFPDLASFPHF